MKECKVTVHGYKIVKPARCKLERLEPVTQEVTMHLHYADAAPVAMRARGPLEYTGKDGKTYVWRDDTIELYALDGMLWKPYDRNGTKRWHPEQWTIEDLADMCAGSHNNNYLHSWPWQWSGEEPPRGLLVRDRGTWATIENLCIDTLASCDKYAVIGGELYTPARELVYTYTYYSDNWGVGHKDGTNRSGRVVIACEYNLADKTKNYLCNALQDWRVVNFFDKYSARIEDKLVNDVTGSDVIEVLMPEYVKADPYADYWANEIKAKKEAAEKCRETAKEHDQRAKKEREAAKQDRNAAKELDQTAQEYAAALQKYLANKKEA